MKAIRVQCEGRFNLQYRRARNTISFLNFIIFFSWYDSENAKCAIRAENLRKFMAILEGELLPVSQFGRHRKGVSRV